MEKSPSFDSPNPENIFSNTPNLKKVASNRHKKSQVTPHNIKSQSMFMKDQSKIINFSSDKAKSIAAFDLLTMDLNSKT